MAGRLTLEDDLLTAITKMSDGIPGAILLLAELTKRTPIIDPCAGLGPFHYLFFLDDMGIYGSHAWVLFKDVCGSDYVDMIAVLRAQQLGLLPRESIIIAISTARTLKPMKLDLDGILATVKEQVPNFGEQAV